MDKEGRHNATALVMAIGRGMDSEEAKAWTFALLVHPVGSPKAQFLAECGWISGASEPQKFLEPRPFPFDIRLLNRASRLTRVGLCPPEHQAFSIVTSDEFVMGLLDQWPVWTLHNAEYKMVLNDTLLDMTVLSHSEEKFEAKARVSKRVEKPVVIPEEFDLGNPFEHGRDGGNAEGLQAKVNFEDLEVAAALGVGLEEVSEAEDEDLSRPRLLADFAEDAYEAAMRDHGFVDGLPEGEAEEDEVFIGADAAFEVAADMLEAHSSLDSDEPTLEQLAESAIVDAEGWVSSPHKPWSEIGRVGRITVWPKAEGDPAKQTVAIRCCMHTTCTVARRRHKFPNEKLLAWLFCAKPLPPTSPAPERELAKRAHGVQAVAKL